MFSIRCFAHVYPYEFFMEKGALDFLNKISEIMVIHTVKWLFIASNNIGNKT